MDIRAAEISRVIRDQIANFDAEAQVSEVGTLLLAHNLLWVVEQRRAACNGGPDAGTSQTACAA